MADQPTPAPKPAVNPNPKARFQSGKGNISDHRAMMELPAFDRGLDFALMEYQSLLADQAIDGNSAMATGFRMQGAMEFISQLKLLAEQTTRPERRRVMDALPDLSGLKRS